MVQRNPSQTLSLGRYNGDMTTHQLPSCTTGRGLRRDVNTFGRTLQEPVAREGGRRGADEKEVAPLGKPIRGNFCALSLVSSPREISERVPKRE